MATIRARYDEKEVVMTTLSIDDAPLTGFHLRVAAFTTGGQFCDGYILGMTGIALAVASPELGLGTIWNGLIAAAALAGILVGAVVFGPVSDRIGRQKLYTLDLLAFVVGAVLQFFVEDAWQLFLLRLLMGVCIGADYAIGEPLLAEFTPRKYRGRMLASLNAVWTVGYVVAYVVGFGLQHLGSGSWRWMLASAAIPALLVVLLRFGTPESPRWLVSKGRVEEARDIVHRYIGPNIGIGDLEAHTGPERSAMDSLREIFSPRWRTRTIVAGLFYACQTVPYFALFSFAPQILSSLGLRDEFTGGLVLNIFLLLGAVVGVLVMDRLPRRAFLLWSFGIATVTLAPLGLWTHAPVMFSVGLFAVFAFVLAAATNLDTLYPNELFPTALRASGVGVAVGMSRIGAAIGTFLLPLGISGFGIGPVLLVGCLILLVGLVVCAKWAPETRGVTLEEASGAHTLVDTAMPVVPQHTAAPIGTFDRQD